jgi:hypothetical protein
MRARSSDRRIGLVVGVAVFVVVACGPESPGGAPSRSDTEAAGSPAEADGLVGVWETEPVTAQRVDTFLRGAFTGAQVDEFERTSASKIMAARTVATILHFGGGQLVISSSIDGDPPHEGWTGTYAIADADTYVSGDAGSGNYITVDFDLDGDRLTLDLIEDRYPDHTPWGPEDGDYPRSITKVVDDRMNQSLIYEIATFTRVG